MKSDYQRQLITRLTTQITEASEDAVLSSSDFVIMAIGLARIELTDEEIERVAERVCEYVNLYSPSVDGLADHIFTIIWQALPPWARQRARYEEYAVEEPSVEAFVQRYYLHTEPGFKFARPERMRKNYEADFAKYGWTFIAERDSVTGQIVSLMRLTPAPGAP